MQKYTILYIILHILISEFTFSQVKSYEKNEYDLKHKSLINGLLINHDLLTDTFKSDLLYIEEIRKIKNPDFKLSSNDSVLLKTLGHADKLLKDGDSETAIKESEKVLELAQKFNHPEIYRGSMETYIKKFIGLCYIRLGEQMNCITGHSGESCIIPIKGKGVHKIKYPMKNAIRVFKEILTNDSTDVESMWLLNIAYMTLGIYPDSVPSKYKIPINTFEVPYKYGKFKDIAPELGLDISGLSGSAIVDDFDNDHDLDIFYINNNTASNCRYFKNNGDGTFTDFTRNAGLIGELGGRTCIQADYNNDGYLDIFILRGAWQSKESNYPPSSLLRNNKDGTFTDVTIRSGLLDFKPSYNGVWFDYNNDGWIDLFISNESPNTGIHHDAKLYKNNGNGTFSNVAKESNLIPQTWTKGSVAFDFDNDGWSDLYICSADGYSYLYKNNGKNEDGIVTFTDITEYAGLKELKISFYTLNFDFNNDGWIDLYAAKSSFNYTSPLHSAINELRGKPSRPSTHSAFYINNQNGTFRYANKEVKLNRVVKNMGINYGDIDNDGYPDIYAGTGDLALSSLMPNLMLRNNEGKYFEDVSLSSGTANLQKGHGVSFGDIDNDGDQDIYQVMGDGYKGDIYQNVLYENPGSPNHWINLKLEGVKSNRAAIGTRVKVNVTTPDGNRDIYAVVSSGGSFGASTLRREIGLANANKINFIEVFWPTSNTTQTFKKVDKNKFYKIIENKNELIPVQAKKIIFKKNQNKPHKIH